MAEPRAEAERICATLSAAGHRALFAGGCVRDMLLGAAPKDYDIASSARPDEVKRLFRRCIPVGEAFGVVLVMTPAGPFEVATFREDGPYEDGRRPASVAFRGEEEDARRRDFTINALFYDPASGEVLDYVGGRADLDAGVVRTVGRPEARFAEDKLRMLRAVRFAARLGFDIDPATADAVRAMAGGVLQTSGERIRDELTKMLTEGAARRAFELLDELGLLRHVLPEIEAMKGVEQPPNWHPEGDVFQHTLLLLEQLDALPDPSPAVAWGALLHDVGKPPTQTFEDRIRFNRHEKVGADMAAAICRRLRMGRADSERIVWIVGQHMRLIHALDMREHKRRRYVREPGFRELLAVCKFDALASHGDLEPFEAVEAYADGLSEEQLRPPPLLTGKDLIGMGFEPGPRFGDWLAAVEDAQLEERIATRDEAEALVRDLARESEAGG